MSTGIQLQKINGDKVLNNESVKFDTTKIQIGTDITYNGLTGAITINKVGVYYVDWWVSTQSTLQNYVKFSIVTQDLKVIPGNSPDLQDEVVGNAILEVTTVPYIINLINTTNQTVYYSTKTPIKANITITTAEGSGKSLLNLEDGNATGSVRQIYSATGYTMGTNSIALGFLTFAIGENSHAEGTRTTALGVASHAEGSSTWATGDSSHAEGGLTKAGGLGSHAEGVESKAYGLGSHAEGVASTAYGFGSHSEGVNTFVQGTASHAEGSNTTASGDHSHAEGTLTLASGTGSHAEGILTQALGIGSHAEGDHTVAVGTASHSEGSLTTASGIYSHAEGFESIAVGYVSHAEGGSTIALGTGSHSEGEVSKALGDASHVEGKYTVALGEASHAEGNLTTAIGKYSHTEGWTTIALGTASHSEGSITTASGIYSHAEGLETIAQGTSSHAEGLKTIAQGTSSHAEGEESQAQGYVSHAEGGRTVALGTGSHSEGELTKAIGETSHAEGQYSIAVGFASHAEGDKTFAIGVSSHSEGYATTASGYASHSQGDSTIADTVHSFAGGLGNTTNGVTGAFIIGKYGAATGLSATTGGASGGVGYNNGEYGFFLGNGQSTGAMGLAAALLSNGSLFIDGGVNTPAADYAEMFETIDGKNIDVGYFVTFADGNKIKIANSKDDYILGVVSSTPGIIGNHQSLRWSEKYITDEWGRIKYHEVDKDGYKKVEPMLNPKWNNKEEYIARINREEWVAVGLLGQIRVRDNGECVVNGYCSVGDNGIAVPSNSGYRVIRRINTNQIIVLFNTTNNIAKLEERIKNMEQKILDLQTKKY